LLREEACAAFDLEAGPLVRGRLIRHGKQDYALLITMHHIVSDGWSMGILFSELNALYAAFARGAEDPLPELPVQYADYALWQRKWIEGAVLAAQVEYWKQNLAGVPEVLEVPADHLRPKQQDFSGAVLQLAVSKKLTAGLKKLSTQYGTTLYMTLLAGWAMLLSRLSGQQDIVIGTPVANRGHVEIEKLIGFFVNTLVLRVDLSGQPTIGEVLERVKQQAIAAQQHQDIPFEQVVEIVKPVRNLAHSPLFQVMFAWQDVSIGNPQLTGLEIEPLESTPHVVSKFDLTLSLQETGNRIVGALEYSTALFKRGSIERYARYYLRLLEGMIGASEARSVHLLPILSEKERRRVLYDWNGTQMEVPSAACVHELFETQVRKTPQAVAVECGDEALSYGELNTRANQLAHYLRGELGVKRDERVGIAMERGLEMMVAVLGILKSGGAYVPLDPAYPQERLQYMVEDSRPVAVLTRDPGPLQEMFAGMKQRVTVVDLNDGQQKWTRWPKENPKRSRAGATGEQLAYVIYTSGSTGKAKGVGIAHRNAVNFLSWAGKAFTPEELDRTLFSTSLNFDLAVYECLAPLIVGGRVRMVGNVLALGTGVEKAEVTLINTVPSAMKALVEEDHVPGTVRVVNLAGEVLKKKLVEEIFARTGVEKVCNLYGPTETTTYSTWVEMKRGEGFAAHIGRPVGNTQVYIVDREMEPVPVGVVGEIYIGGAGVARGYVDREEMTAERFVPDPFIDGKDKKQAAARMYRTGDLGKWRKDGQIEFLGRNDFQVKIRGFRIELGEIEARLTECAGVREAVVLAREDKPGEKRLVAYFTTLAESDGLQNEASVEELRKHLIRKLPEYMVPAAYVRLEKLPLTANGKLDRKALPAPELPEIGRRKPRTAQEEILAELFAEVLGLKEVGIDDNFFALGGHSLLIIGLVSRIRSTLGAEISLRDLFEAPTVELLGERLLQSHSAHPPLRKVSRPAEIPLSFAQQRLWFLDQLQPGSRAYNVPLAVRLKGILPAKVMERVFEELVRRHEALRTTFEAVEGVARQVIVPPSKFSLPLTDLSSLPQENRETEALRLTRAETDKPFDLGRGPLLRAHLLRLAEQDHLLLLTMHHIVTDGWSMGIIMQEIARLYEAYLKNEDPGLPELGIQYADYAIWQREWLQGETLERQLAYWEKQLANLPHVHGLALDRPRPAVQTFQGAEYTVEVEQATVEAIKKIAINAQMTFFMALHGVFALLLSRYANSADIVIGTPVANRLQKELEGMVGFFVNTLVLRTDCSSGQTFWDYLAHIRNVNLEAHAHQDVPFEHIVERLNPHRSANLGALFQIMFSIGRKAEMESWLPGLSSRLLGGEETLVKFDLMVDAVEQNEGLSLSFAYDSDLFEASTIQRMGEHYRNLLRSVAANPRAKIGELPLLASSEQHHIVHDFNQTTSNYQLDQCVHELVEAHAQRDPEATAAIFEGRKLSYSELDKQANQLAHYLVKLGAGPEVRVGICVERGLEMLVGLLGILKAGSAYVPLDPAYPADRLAYMVEDAQAKVLLTQSKLRGRLPKSTGRIIELDKDWETIAQENFSAAASRATAENLIYVIYTSGSTGRPKGVAVEHRQVANQLFWAGAALSLSSADRVLQKASFSFDASILEIFLPLAWGSQIVVARPGGEYDVEYLVQLAIENQITYVDLAPALLEHLLEDPNISQWTSLRVMSSGADVLRPELVNAFYQHVPGELWNTYGPTETTVQSTFTLCTAGGHSVPIGKPIANTQIYVLDALLQPVPLGVAGDLYIGGVGVTRGYLEK
ncbi:MAG TPA: amino acid adenylation domain-containing protein, partial [Candidatus Angelobacter sp.]